MVWEGGGDFLDGIEDQCEFLVAMVGIVCDETWGSRYRKHRQCMEHRVDCIAMKINFGEDLRLRLSACADAAPICMESKK